MSKSSIDKPSLQNVIEDIGCGPAQARYCFTGGGVYIAEGSFLLLINAITTALTNEWGLTAMQRGFFVTIAYFGVLAGNLSSGPIGDAYGRRIVILASYLVVFFSCLGSSYAEKYGVFCFVQFIVGYGMGLGVPAWNALAVEVTPRHSRMLMGGFSMSFFTAGEVYCALLIAKDDPTMMHLDWRTLVRAAAVPGALFFVATLFWMHQSPSYLALHGLEEEARNVLSSNARDNSLTDISVDFKPVHLPESQILGSQFLPLFNQQLLPTTLVCLYTAIMCNQQFFSMIYAAPQLLPTLQATSSSAAMTLVLGALWEFPGYAIGIVMGKLFPRKSMLKCVSTLCATFTLLFVLGTTWPPSWAAEAAYKTGFYGSKLLASTFFVAIYLYVAEVYPTSLRTTANAVAIGGGRIGAMACPLLYEFILEKTGSHALYFYIGGFLLLTNTLIIDFAPFEPSTQIMLDTLEETENLVQSTKGSPQNPFYGVAGTSE